jgi:selenide,water dikinase
MQTFLQRLDDRMEFVAPKPRQMLQIDVVGGCVASVEIALCLQTRFQLQFPKANVKIRVLTAADEIAFALAKNGVHKIRRILHSIGIEILTQTRVSEVNDSGMMSNRTDSLSADCVSWSTSAVAPPVLLRLGLPVDEHGFLLTSSTMQSTADPMVFAVGYFGSVAGISFAKAGVHTVRQSPLLWHNLRSLLVGERMSSFTPQNDFLKILNTCDGLALVLYKSLAIHARWCWTLKTRIDRRFRDAAFRYIH